jgi:apolipoprotein N-acyltransferase
MPREGIWPLIFASVAALVLSVKGLTLGKSLFVGFIGGASFYLSQIEWLSLYLGPVPWLALSILEAAIFAVGMAAISRAMSWIAEFKAKDFQKAFISVAVVSTIWTAREWVSINLPYGGFPWSRLAQTQSESPLASWVSILGFSGLSFIIAAISVALAEFMIAVRNRDQVWVRTGLAALVAALVLPGFVIPTSAEAENGYLTVAGIQGNANAGLFANPVRGSILQNHLDASNMAKDSPLAGEIDLMVWPENASDLSPFIDANANSRLTEFVDKDIQIPLVFGTITTRGDEIFNSSIFWQPNIGPTDYYDKKRPVPFAEYIPDRDFWYQLAPDLVGLITRGYSFGERDGIFELPSTEHLRANGVEGEAKLGALICFEIAVDDIGRELAADGAQVILSQTNNADFGHSDETYQQAALAKLRAIETGRAVVNVSTVGVSAIYLPNGETVSELPAFEPAAIVEKVPLRNSQTVAMVIGGWFDLAVNLLALLLVAAAYRSAWPPARRARM